jgi:hypothetical protein
MRRDLSRDTTPPADELRRRLINAIHLSSSVLERLAARRILIGTVNRRRIRPEIRRVSPDTRRGLRPRFARVDAAGLACFAPRRHVTGYISPVASDTRSLCRDQRGSEASFFLPRGGILPLSSPGNALPFARCLRRDLQREFPHDCRSEADEQSHFFYLLILIRGCLEPSLPPSHPPTLWHSLASPASSPSRLAASSLRRALRPPSFSVPTVDLPFSLTELHAQCQSLQSRHRIPSFLCSPFAFSEDL